MPGSIPKNSKVSLGLRALKRALTVSGCAARIFDNLAESTVPLIVSTASSRTTVAVPLAAFAVLAAASWVAFAAVSAAFTALSFAPELRQRERKKTGSCEAP